jgi:thioredoxin-related protein
MADEKKKVTAKKKSSAQKTTKVKKESVSKKEVKKVNKVVKKNLAPKKEVAKTPKKPVAKKPVVKEVKEPVVQKVDVPVETKVDKEALEKTIIINGLEKKNIEEVAKKIEEKKVQKVDKSDRPRILVIVFIAILMIALVIFTVIKVLNNEKVETGETIGSNIAEKIEKGEIKEPDKVPTDPEEENGYKEKYDAIKLVSLGEFQSAVKANPEMAVLVMSSTCYYCAEFEPVVNEVLKEQGKVIYEFDLARMSDEDIATLRSYYYFTSTPTIFTIGKDGKVVSDIEGYQNKNTFSEWAEKNIVK